jgi:hypothetical protein
MIVFRCDGKDKRGADTDERLDGASMLSTCQHAHPQNYRVRLGRMPCAYKLTSPASSSQVPSLCSAWEEPYAVPIRYANELCPAALGEYRYRAA